MARKNTRKRRKQQLNGFIFPLPFAGVVVMASALALGYVWLGCQCEALGDEIKTLEAESVELNKKQLTAEYHWVRTKSPRSMEIALQRHGINMDWPRAGQVVRLERGSISRGPDSDALTGGVRMARVNRLLLHE